MGNFENEEESLDVNKTKRMIYRIYALERENTKTGKYNEKQMKEEIKKIIEEEAKKCY